MKSGDKPGLTTPPDDGIARRDTVAGLSSIRFLPADRQKRSYAYTAGRPAFEHRTVSRAAVPYYSYIISVCAALCRYASLHAAIRRPFRSALSGARFACERIQCCDDREPTPGAFLLTCGRWAAGKDPKARSGAQRRRVDRPVAPSACSERPTKEGANSAVERAGERSEPDALLRRERRGWSV